MNSDLKLKKHVEDELSWEPSVDAAAIGVGVKDAIVTLSGHVSSFAEKHAAEAAVMRIHGVRALANELEVRLSGDSHREDDDIARTAAFALNWNSSVPKDRVKISVSNGIVSLEGTVDWNFQRVAAEKTVSHLMGVKGVNNLLTVKAVPMRTDVKSQIESALKRNAEAHADHIQVTISGSKVILSGTAETMSDRFAAEVAAWKAPGVSMVENDIEVSSFATLTGVI